MVKRKVVSDHTMLQEDNLLIVLSSDVLIKRMAVARTEMRLECSEDLLGHDIEHPVFPGTGEDYVSQALYLIKVSRVLCDDVVSIDFRMILSQITEHVKTVVPCIVTPLTDQPDVFSPVLRLCLRKKEEPLCHRMGELKQFHDFTKHLNLLCSNLLFKESLFENTGRILEELGSGEQKEEYKVADYEADCGIDDKTWPLACVMEGTKIPGGCKRYCGGSDVFCQVSKVFPEHLLREDLMEQVVQKPWDFNEHNGDDC